MADFELDPVKVAAVEQAWLDAIGADNFDQVERIGKILRWLKPLPGESATGPAFVRRIAAAYRRDYGLPLPKALLP